MGRIWYTDRYEKEEREKKIRRIREEQQRIAIAKQQRLGAAAAAAVTKGFPSRPAATQAAQRQAFTGRRACRLDWQTGHQWS